jgi:hypothetical protein
MGTLNGVQVVTHAGQWRKPSMQTWSDNRHRMPTLSEPTHRFVRIPIPAQVLRQEQVSRKQN